MRCWACLLCVLTCFAPIATGADRPESGIAVALRAGRIVDGFPAESEWSRARSAMPFLTAGQAAEAGRLSEFRALYDDKALYVRVRADEPDADRLVGKRLDQNVSVFDNDCVELFLGSVGRTDSEIQLVVDVAGQRWESKGVAKWQRQWRSRVRRDGKGFTAWFAVPFGEEGWEKPERGSAWRIKVGRESKTGGGNSMWPLNPDTKFRSPKAWGLVYFGTENLLTGGGFEKASGDKTIRAPGWSCPTGNRKWGQQGTVRVVSGPLPDGGKAVELRKTVKAAWYPQVNTTRIKTKPSQAYVASAWVQATKGATFQAVFFRPDGSKERSVLAIPESLGKAVHSELSFTTPPKCESMVLSFKFMNTKGVMTIDDVSLRVNPLAASETAGVEPGDGHPIHRLIELSQRTRIPPPSLAGKPVDVFPCERVVFRDTATGATVWKMTRWPGTTRHNYANMRCWNANGQLVKLLSSRTLSGESFLLRSDGSELRRIPVRGRHWCPANPDRLLCGDITVKGSGRDRIITTRYYRYNVRTGEKWQYPQTLPRSYLLPITLDGKKMLVVTHHQSRDARKSQGYFIDVETGRHNVLDFRYVTHQVWFTKRPDYTISLNYEVQNKYVIEAGGDLGSWLIDCDGGNLRKVRDHHMSHRAFSPDGKRVAFHSGGIAVMNVDGTGEKIVSRHSGGHVSWQVTPKWAIPSTGNALRCVGMADQGFDYVICRPNFQTSFLPEGGKARPESSPDGTKVAFTSTMLGDFDYYNVVSRLPGAPRNVRAELTGGTARLTWSPPEFHKEVKGYLIYRSSESGLNFEQITPKPVANPPFVDALPPGADKAYYFVTAVEHSGLEGRPPAEVCASASGIWEGPVRHYHEMEDGGPVKPLMEHFDSQASNMYALRMASGFDGKAALAVNVPRAGAFAVWLRAKCKGSASVNLASLKPVAIRTPHYMWHRVGTVELAEGVNHLSMECDGPDLRLDALLLTDQADATPNPDLLWDRAPPAAPAGLRVARTGGYEIEIEWSPVADVDVSHYNVYASTRADLKLSQERLIVSTTAPKYLDWGLQQGTKYHYRVTAVDRRGNESAPSAQLATATRKIRRVLVKKRIGGPRPKSAQGKGPVPVARLKAVGAFAETARVLARSKPVEAVLGVPRDGQYLLWMKFAVRPGSRFRSLRVTINGRAMSWRPALEFVSIGHSGPVPGIFMWDTVGTAKPAGSQVLELKAGPVNIVLSPPSSAAELEVAELVLTNDMGWQPKGIHSYLAPDRPWTKKTDL